MANFIFLPSRWRYGIALLLGLYAGLCLHAAQAQTLPAAPAETAASDTDTPYHQRRKAFREQTGLQKNSNLPDRSVLLPPKALTADVPPAPATQPVIAVEIEPPLADAAPKKLRSPAIQINRETIHLTPPEEARVDAMPPAYEWAKLVPAAGAADLETMVPLIPVPDPTASESKDKPEALPPTASATSADISPPPAVHEAPAPAPYNAMALDNLLQQMQGPQSRASTAPETLPSVPVAAGEAPKVAAPVAAPAATVAEPAGTVAETEPSPTLSGESMDILNKIPSNLDGKRVSASGDVDINRAKDTKYVSKTEEAPAADAPASAQSETMGMKIAVKHSPININYELEKAYNALISGHPQAAIEIYRTVLSNDPGNRDALFGLATTYHRAGQIDMARPLYGKLLSLDPQHRDALNNFLVLLADEAPQEAITEMEKLEEKHPTFSPIPAQLAVIYQKQGQTDKASDKMFKAVALAPENLTYRYNLAILLDKQNKSEEAVKLYRQLVEAHMRGETIPGNIQKIQERLTFLRSNR